MRNDERSFTSPSERIDPGAEQAHRDDLGRDELIVIATDAIDGIEPAARPQHSPWPSTERLATAVVDALLDRLAAAYGEQGGSTT